MNNRKPRRHSDGTRRLLVLFGTVWYPPGDTREKVGKQIKNRQKMDSRTESDGNTHNNVFTNIMFFSNKYFQSIALFPLESGAKMKPPQQNMSRNYGPIENAWKVQPGMGTKMDLKPLPSAGNKRRQNLAPLRPKKTG